MEKERLYYIDWLRVLVVLSLIPFHSALTYTGFGDTYINAPVSGISVIPLRLFVNVLGSFFMSLLFFVSGIASYHSMQHRGEKGFVGERFRKLLIPLILGTLFLCPAQAYFKGLYEGFTGNLIQFLPEFFSEKIVYYMGYAHLWFLLYLFIFSLVCRRLFSGWLRNNTKLSRITDFLLKGKNIYLPIFFIIAAETLLGPFFPGPQTFVTDIANDVVSLSLFICGFVFASDNRIQERIGRLGNISALFCAIITVLYIAVHFIDFSWVNVFVWYLVQGIYKCAAIIFVIYLGKKYLNRKSAALSYLSRASFTYYVFHFLPISVLTYLIVGMKVNYYIRYLLVVLLSYVFVFGVNEIFVRRIGATGVRKKEEVGG